MPKAHRNGDRRICGASTIVVNQGSVTVNGRLWAVKGDVDSHGMGALKNSFTSVYVEGIPVIVHTPDSASPDAICFIVDGPHCNPKTAQGSGDVFAYGG